MIGLPVSVEHIVKHAEHAVEQAERSVAERRFELDEAEGRLTAAREALAYWSAVPKPVLA